MSTLALYAKALQDLDDARAEVARLDNELMWLPESMRDELAAACGYLGEDEDEYPEWKDLLAALHKGFCAGVEREPFAWVEWRPPDEVAARCYLDGEPCAGETES